MTYSLPLPEVNTEPHETFWRATAEDRLLVQECRACNRRQFFPRPWCQYCFSPDTQWLESTGEGVVYTYTVIRRATELQAFEAEVPYVVGYVELSEGPRMCTNIVECDPADVYIGQPVTVTFDHVTDGIALPKFRPQK